MRGKCLSDSSSHEVIWEMMSLIDQASVTQDSVIVKSDRPEYASFSICQALSKCFKSCDLSRVSSPTYGIFHTWCLILSVQRRAKLRALSAKEASRQLQPVVRPRLQ